jgi:hypothetical protein
MNESRAKRRVLAYAWIRDSSGVTAMPEPTQPPSNPDSASVSGPEPQAGRRRLLRGGLAAAPVLMTLVSRPVLAQQCQTPSGFVSGNASVAVGAGPTCQGRTPGYWKQSQWFHSWVPPYYPTTVGGQGGHQATLFDAVFTPHYSGKTLLQVLQMGGGPPNDVARHVVAALLNAAAGWTPVLTVAGVNGIWSEYITKGYFEPTAGVHWGDAQIVSYLLSTMPA